MENYVTVVKKLECDIDCNNYYMYILYVTFVTI